MTKKQKLEKAELYYRKANNAYERGDYKVAVNNLKKVIRLNPNYAKAYNNLAILYYKVYKDTDNAQKNFMHALEIDPNFSFAIINLNKISNFEHKTFISEFDIKNVRLLRDIKIPLSKTRMKHLFFTGKNASGKTSVLKESENYIQRILEIPVHEIFTEKGKKEFWHEGDDYKLKFNVKRNLLDLRMKYEAGIFSIVFFGDERKLEHKLKPVKSIVPIDFQVKTLPKEDLSLDLLVYLIWLDYKKKSNIETNKINRFFDKIHSILKQIYKDDALTFDVNLSKIKFGDNMNFTIKLSNGSEFNLDEMAAGYSAIFKIIFELILRTEAKPYKENSEGIVFIDEPEAHLHISMQKEIMPILIKMFPHMQFVIATHSSFILNSVANAVIYDLENRICTDDFSEIPSSYLNDFYFNFDKKYVKQIENKVDEFERLINLYRENKITEKDQNILAELEIELDEITPYISKKYFNKFKENQEYIYQ